MGRATKFILIALLSFTLFAAAQTASAPSSPERSATATEGGTVQPAAQGTPVPNPAPAVSPETTQTAAPPPADSASNPPAKRELNIAGFKFQRPDLAGIDQDDSNLPPASSPLPLISVIGFGVLVGGIISAMKTRS